MKFHTLTLEDAKKLIEKRLVYPTNDTPIFLDCIVRRDIFIKKPYIIKNGWRSLRIFKNYQNKEFKIDNLYIESWTNTTLPIQIKEIPEIGVGILFFDTKEFWYKELHPHIFKRISI